MDRDAADLREPAGSASLSREYGESLSDYLGRLAAIYGWGSREVQDAYDYETAEVPDE